MNYARLFCFWLILSTGFSFADTDGCDPTIVLPYSFQLDQDVGITDQNYTNGVSAGGELKQPWIKDRLVEFREAWGIESSDSCPGQFQWRFGTSVFTPEDIETRQIQRGDRPYATLAFIDFQSSVLYTARSGNERRFQSGVSLGLLGLDFGEHVQSAIHGNDRPPLGWDNQVAEGGTPVAMLYASSSQLLRSDQLLDAFRFELSSSYGGSFGYYTGASAQLNARLGLFADDWYVFESNYHDNFDQVGSAKRFFLWSRITGRAVAYNALLQGVPFADNTYTLSASEVNRFVLEYSIGLGGTINEVEWVFGIKTRGEEFSGSEARSHTWWTLGFRWG
ncbi:MAG: lipid A-modifier LpxR family protein [Pseudomonadota bacterium]